MFITARGARDMTSALRKSGFQGAGTNGTRQMRRASRTKRQPQGSKAGRGVRGRGPRAEPQDSENLHVQKEFYKYL